MVSLKQKISNIYSYIELLDKHVDKVNIAVSVWNLDVLDHYRIEYLNFTIQAEKVLVTLNDHEMVFELKEQFITSKTSLDFLLKKYGK